MSVVDQDLLREKNQVAEMNTALRNDHWQGYSAAPNAPKPVQQAETIKGDPAAVMRALAAMMPPAKPRPAPVTEFDIECEKTLARLNAQSSPQAPKPQSSIDFKAIEAEARADYAKMDRVKRSGLGRIAVSVEAFIAARLDTAKACAAGHHAIAEPTVKSETIDTRRQSVSVL